MVNIDELVAKLESESPDATFLSKLAAEPTSPVTAPAPTAAPATPAQPTAAAAPVVEPTVPTQEDIRKQAEEYDAQGRIIARGFYDELKKLATGTVGMTPNPDAVPENPAVQVSNTEAREADVAKIEAILQQLTQGGRMKGPQGFVQQNNQPVAATQPIAVDEHPVAADAHRKAASVLLYSKYFGGK